MFRLLIIQLVVARVPAPSSCGDHCPGLTSGVITGAFGGKDDGGRTVLMPWGCETEQKTSPQSVSTVCPSPVKHIHKSQKQLPRRVNRTPALRSKCSQEEGYLPKLQLDEWKWKKNSEGDEECLTIKMLAKNSTDCAEDVTYHLLHKVPFWPWGQLEHSFQRQDNGREWEGWGERDRGKRESMATETLTTHVLEGHGSHNFYRKYPCLGSCKMSCLLIHT